MTSPIRTKKDVDCINRHFECARRAWIDWKSSVKKKAAEIIKENNKTGGGSPSGKQLSELEARCAALLGRTAITGMEEIPSTASDEEISAETPRRPLGEISCSKRPLMENDSGSSSKKKRNEVPLQEIVDLQERQDTSMDKMGEKIDRLTAAVENLTRTISNMGNLMYASLERLYNKTQ
ncbi:uncharacterized protein LOC129218783 [Uloborus diversus]|uniref:uncharacterized protein LOC129218783 n=1 Tax=Uloborus diversus TaxID=327109 RepID=UPI0024096C68|nr:uncharacterized protein LOC129218783 [Uloborus diversus]